MTIGNYSQPMDERRLASGRPRSYIGIACDQCFRRKVRCEGTQPACDRCVANNGLCSYSTGKSPRGSKRGQKSPPTPTTKKRKISQTLAEEGQSSSMIDFDDYGASIRRPSLTNYTQIQSESASLSIHEATPPSSIGPPSASLMAAISPESLPPVETLPPLLPATSATYEYHPTATMPEDQYQPLHLDFMPPVPPTSLMRTPVMSPPLDLQDRTLPAFADPYSTKVVFELCKCQLLSPTTPVDIMLQLCSDAVSLIASYIPADIDLAANPQGIQPRTHPRRSPNSNALALACIHITQQVLLCYARLHAQLELLDDPSRHLEIRIGGFNLYGASSTRAVLQTIVNEEIRGCTKVVRRLEQWIYELASTTQHGSEVLLTFLQTIQALAAMPV